MESVETQTYEQKLIKAIAGLKNLEIDVNENSIARYDEYQKRIQSIELDSQLDKKEKLERKIRQKIRLYDSSQKGQSLQEQLSNYCKRESLAQSIKESKQNTKLHTPHQFLQLLHDWQKESKSLTFRKLLCQYLPNTQLTNEERDAIGNSTISRDYQSSPKQHKSYSGGIYGGRCHVSYTAIKTTHSIKIKDLYELQLAAKHLQLEGRCKETTLKEYQTAKQLARKIETFCKIYNPKPNYLRNNDSLEERMNIWSDRIENETKRAKIEQAKKYFKFVQKEIYVK